LELAGSVSALSGDGTATPAAANRANVVNDATNVNSTTGGVIASGTNQQVGGIDGTGDTTVNAGASLTADHIIQNALVIGGDGTNVGLMTIAASNSSGNPAASSLAALGNSAPISVGGSTLLAAGSPAVDGTSMGGLGSLAHGSGSAAVPEPSTLALLGLGSLACLLSAWKRRNNRLKAIVNN
jgi:hypothetical protein